jgi:hypothetical protein
MLTTHPHLVLKSRMSGSYTFYPHKHLWVIPCQINTGHNLTLSELNFFLWHCSPNGHKYSCQMLLLYGHYIFESRHPKLSKKPQFLGTSCFRKSGITSVLIEIQTHFLLISKLIKCLFQWPITPIFSTVVFKVSKFDLWPCISQTDILI